MKEQLTQVVSQKAKNKSQLSDLKNRYIVLIYSGLCKKKTLKEIHKKLYDETINRRKVGELVSPKMLNIAFSLTKTLKKQTDNTDYVKRSVNAQYGIDIDEESESNILGYFVYGLLKKKKVENKLSKVITAEVNKIEGASKIDILDETSIENIDNANKEVEKDEKSIDTDKIKIFYLASKHRDCAVDHQDWQGKIYVDADWESINMPFELHNAIDYYLKRNNIQTMQWVINRPVWFITRPNCRHYFRVVSVKEVLENSTRDLLNKYGMSTAIGNRQYLQTINHSTSKRWYDDIRNAQLLLEKYKERLSLHEQMYKENPTPLLKSAIEKDKMLISKWEEYINARNK